MSPREPERVDAALPGCSQQAGVGKGHPLTLPVGPTLAGPWGAPYKGGSCLAHWDMCPQGQSPGGMETHVKHMPSGLTGQMAVR